MADKHKGGMAIIIGVGKPNPRNPLPPLDTPEQRQRHAADVEASFTGRRQPNGTYDEDASSRANPEQAGYMELEGARKGGDCELVDVPGGVSPLRGCCNLFTPPQSTTDADGVVHASGASAYNCGQCVHISAGAGAASGGAGPLQPEEAING